MRAGGLRARGIAGHRWNARAVRRSDPRFDAGCAIAVPPVRYADGAGQANSTAGLSPSTLTVCYLAV